MGAGRKVLKTTVAFAAAGILTSFLVLAHLPPPPDGQPLRASRVAGAFVLWLIGPLLLSWPSTHPQLAPVELGLLGAALILCSGVYVSWLRDERASWRLGLAAALWSVIGSCSAYALISGSV